MKQAYILCLTLFAAGPSNGLAEDCLHGRGFFRPAAISDRLPEALREVNQGIENYLSKNELDPPPLAFGPGSGAGADGENGMTLDLSRVRIEHLSLSAQVQSRSPRETELVISVENLKVSGCTSLQKKGELLFDRCGIQIFSEGHGAVMNFTHRLTVASRAMSLSDLIKIQGLPNPKIESERLRLKVPPSAPPVSVVETLAVKVAEDFLPTLFARYWADDVQKRISNYLQSLVSQRLAALEHQFHIPFLAVRDSRQREELLTRMEQFVSNLERVQEDLLSLNWDGQILFLEDFFDYLEKYEGSISGDFIKALGYIEIEMSHVKKLLGFSRAAQKERCQNIPWGPQEVLRAEEKIESSLEGLRSRLEKIKSDREENQVRLEFASPYALNSQNLITSGLRASPLECPEEVPNEVAFSLSRRAFDFGGRIPLEVVNDWLSKSQSARLHLLNFTVESENGPSFKFNREVNFTKPPRVAWDAGELKIEIEIEAFGYPALARGKVFPFACEEGRLCFGFSDIRVAFNSIPYKPVDMLIQSLDFLVDSIDPTEKVDRVAPWRLIDLSRPMENALKNYLQESGVARKGLRLFSGGELVEIKVDPSAPWMDVYFRTRVKEVVRLSMPYLGENRFATNPFCSQF